MGSETEYGIATPSDPGLSPIITSTHAVVGYAAVHTSARSRWDFHGESPLRDSRGFDLRRYHTVPVVDPDAVGVANVVVDNGARFYVDHAHPEYSSPECSNAWDVMVYDAAGDLIVLDAVRAVAQLTQQGISVLKDHQPCPELKIYKNNTDGKGASYGAHENYQYARETDFDVLAQGLIPFFVTRPVLIGAGRVGLGEDGATPGFQISQRADYFKQEISLETTLNRGIINTRDEPHADADRFCRLHTIVGDANLSQTATFLKFGMTSMVLDAIESGVDFSDLALRDPVAELKAVSRDLSLTHRLQLADGRELSATRILREYLERVRVRGGVDKRVVEEWSRVLDLLDADPMRTADLLDWTAKLRLIRSFMDRGVPAGDAKLKLIDLQYCDIDPKRGLYHALVRKGAMRTLVDAPQLRDAASHPPRDSRAWLRATLVRDFGEHVLAASWQSVVLACSTGAAQVRFDDVDSCTFELAGPIIEHAGGDVTALLDGLSRLERCSVERYSSR